MEALDKQFGITEAGSTVEGEIRAGITTFLTMAYILLVNPAMLSGTGIPFNDALFATAIAAFVGCIIMGLWANLPFALAPGMGLNAYFTFGVVIGLGIDWEIALAAVFVEGLIFLIISLPQVGWRTQMINAIPTDLKIATGAGIGMFLAMIGLEETGLVVNNAVTLVDIGPHASWTYQSGELIAIVGLIAIAGMMARGMKGAIIWGIVGMSIYGWAVGASDPYNTLGNADPLIFYFDADGNMVDLLATASYMCVDAAGNTGCYYAGTDVLVAVNVASGWGAATATAPAGAARPFPYSDSRFPTQLSREMDVPSREMDVALQSEPRQGRCVGPRSVPAGIRARPGVPGPCADPLSRREHEPGSPATVPTALAAVRPFPDSERPLLS